MNQTNSAEAAKLAKKLEHSVLGPGTTRAEIVAGCAVARDCGARVMMVQPAWLELAVAELAGSDVAPASVLAFPHGAALPETKASEAAALAALGAREIDMVMNVGALRSGDYDAVHRDVAGVVEATGESPVKVILEICLLTNEEIVAACKICETAGAAFVKTSTGFSKSGATAGAVALMRRSVGENVGVKASGGIRTLDQALEMIRAGADRIGTSSTAAILGEMRERG